MVWCDENWISSDFGSWELKLGTENKSKYGYRNKV
jgi:hypothetical protein